MLNKTHKKDSNWKELKFLGLLSLLLLIGFIVCPQSLFAEAPKPGDVITSSNVDQYKEYLPDYMARWVKDGWEIEEPATFHVGEKTGFLLHPDFLAATQKNINKVTLTDDGNLQGYSGIGLPFPEPKEPNKALKIMWNNMYRSFPDDVELVNYRDHSKRKGGRIVTSQNSYIQLKHSGRVVIDPKPCITPNSELFWTTRVRFGEPPAKDLEVLSWRYNDVSKDDEMWSYLPTLRRSIRMVSSERSNPINGLPTSWDDINGFDGKVSKFDYKLLGEQEVLIVLNQKKNLADFENRKYDYPIVRGDVADYGLADMYLVEIKSKDPRYPESKKIAWLSKESYFIPYAASYDKQGNLWKGYACAWGPRLDAQGVKLTSLGMSGVRSFKTEFWYVAVPEEMPTNTGEVSPELFAPSALGTY